MLCRAGNLFIVRRMRVRSHEVRTNCSYLDLAMKLAVPWWKRLTSSVANPLDAWDQPCLSLWTPSIALDFLGRSLIVFLDLFVPSDRWSAHVHVQSPSVRYLVRLAAYSRESVQIKMFKGAAPLFLYSIYNYILCSKSFIDLLHFPLQQRNESMRRSEEQKSRS